MSAADGFEFPPAEAALLRKARRVEWSSLGFLLSAIVLMYLVMGSSQAMKTAWLENVISFVPPVAFLIGSRIALRPPNARFRYGYHTAVSIAYLTAALALLAMGLFLLIEAAAKLISGERPTIGGFVLFGTVVWAGWPMLAVLAYSSIPSFFLGRMKLRLAGRIHDKALYADADMNKADWLAESATALGVLGVGFGYWWADALAAAIVSVDIVNDGWRNIASAVGDLLARRPTKVDRSGPEPWPDRVQAHLEAMPWVRHARVRMREQGHVFFAEAFIVPRDEFDTAAEVAAARAEVVALNWRIHDVVIGVVRSLAEAEAQARAQEAFTRGGAIGGAAAAPPPPQRRDAP